MSPRTHHKPGVERRFVRGNVECIRTAARTLPQCRPNRRSNCAALHRSAQNRIVGAVVFVWSAIAHMANLLGTAGLRVMSNEDAVIAAKKNGIPESGLYFFPGAHMSREMTPQEYQAWEAKIKAGPVGLLVYTATGTNPVS